jgi:hypothetical protein
MCRSRPEAKIHPRHRRGCKVCLQPGSHIGPAVAAGCGAIRGATRRRNADAATAPPEGALCEATRRAIRQWQPREREREATRGLTVGNAGRCAAGQPWSHQRLGGVAEERMRGNPEIHRLRAEGPKDWRFEAPRSSIAGTAEDAGRGATRGRIEKLNGTMLGSGNLSSSRSRRQRFRSL